MICAGPGGWEDYEGVNMMLEWVEKVRNGRELGLLVRDAFYSLLSSLLCLIMRTEKGSTPETSNVSSSFYFPFPAVICRSSCHQSCLLKLTSQWNVALLEVCKARVPAVSLSKGRGNSRLSSQNLLQTNILHSKNADGLLISLSINGLPCIRGLRACTLPCSRFVHAWWLQS